MTRSARRVDAAVAAVADGRAVDWERLEADASPDERALLRQLRALGSARPQTPDVTTSRTAEDVAADWFLGFIVAVAAVQVVAAAVAGIVAVSRGAAVGAAPVAYPGVPLAFGAGAALLLWSGRSDRAARALGGFFLLVASAFAGSRTAGIVAAAHGAGALVPRWLLTLPLDAFLPVFLLSFVVAFARLPAFVRPQAMAERLLQVSWFVGLGLFAANLVHQWMPSQHGPMLEWFDRARPMSGAYWPAVCGLSLAACALAAWKARRVLGEEGVRAATLLAAVAAGATPLALTTVLLGVGGRVGGWVLQDKAGLGVVVYGGLLTIPLSTAVVVLSRRVFNLRWALSRAGAWRAARSVPPLVALCAAGLVASLLYASRADTLAQLFSRPLAPAIASLAVVGVSMALVYGRWAVFVSARILGERRDLSASLVALSVAAAESGDAQAPGLALIAEVERSLRAEHADVLIRDVRSGDCAPLVGTRYRPPAASSVLLESLRLAHDPVSLDLDRPRAITRWLPEDDRQWVLDTGCRLLVPLTAAEGELLGLLALGPKRSGTPYTRADRRFLMRLAMASARLLEARPGPEAAVDGVAEGRVRDSRGPEAFECQGCGLVAAVGGRCACGGQRVVSALPAVLAGKFQIEQRVGRGGMGIVYRGVDLDLHRPVAVKTLPRTSAQAAGRLRREARAMAALVHPNLAAIYSLETWRGLPLLVVEYMPGGTLAERLNRGGLSPASVVAIGRALASALVTMHASGILHRDVKPGNIGLLRDGTPKLLDFGLAHVLGERALRPGKPSRGLGDRPATMNRMGTAAYLPPEGLRPGDEGPSRDLWALALVLYEALAGVNPRRRGTGSGRHSPRSGPIPDVRTFVPECPAPLAAFLASCLSADPRRRPQTARRLLDGLNAVDLGPRG